MPLKLDTFAQFPFTGIHKQILSIKFHRDGCAEWATCISSTALSGSETFQVSGYLI